MVWWRAGASRGPVPRTCKRCAQQGQQRLRREHARAAPRPTRCASGNPSRRWQIAATAPAFAAVRAKRGTAARARSTKRATAGAVGRRRAAIGTGRRERAAVDTGKTCSPRTWSGARLVASTCSAGQPDQQRGDELGGRGQDMLAVVQQEQALPRPEVGDQASVSGRSALGVTPRAAATVAGTSAGSASGARSTQITPSAKCAATSLGDGQRQPRLADATGAGQRQERDGLLEQEGAGRRALRLPADEAGAGDGKRGGQLGRDVSDHAGILREDPTNTM